MDCLFCRIVAGEIPARTLYEDDQVLAFHDIGPQAPVHFLVIPKKHISTLNHLSEEDKPLAGHVLYTAQQLALEHSGQPCGGEDIAQGRMQRLRSLQDLLWQVCLPTVLHHALEVRLHRLRGCV